MGLLKNLGKNPERILGQIHRECRKSINGENAGEISKGIYERTQEESQQCISKSFIENLKKIDEEIPGGITECWKASRDKSLKESLETILKQAR